MGNINNNITNIKDIKVGDHLEMQCEDDPQHGYFDWGIVELFDILRFKRELDNGIYLWRKAKKE